MVFCVSFLNWALTRPSLEHLHFRPASQLCSVLVAVRLNTDLQARDEVSMGDFLR